MALGQSLAHFAVCSPGSGCKEHGWTSEHHPGGHHAPTATGDPQCEPATVKSDFWCCYCLWARLLSMDQWKSLSLLPWTRWGSTQLLWRLQLDRCHCTQHSCTSRGMARWKASAVLALCCKGGISMDLADSYNYFANGTEWYHDARTRFLNEELLFLEGVWGSPYFDAGAGEICMITYSVPFTRLIPVPQVPVPDWLDTSLYGLSVNRGRQTNSGVRYFWGIATVDIDLSIVSFTCDPNKGAEPGSFFNNKTGRCEQCPVGSRLLDNICISCYEYEYSTEDRSDCLLNELYVLYGFVFHLWLAILVLPAGLKLQRRFYVFGVKHDGETGGFILQLCNKHGIHVSSSRQKKSFPRIYM